MSSILSSELFHNSLVNLEKDKGKFIPFSDHTSHILIRHMVFQMASESDNNQDQYIEDEEDGLIRPLDAKDYLAIFLAALRTIFLPILAFIFILICLGLLFSLFF